MPLGAELDEVGPLEGGLGEENTVVGNDTDLLAVDAGEAWVGLASDCHGTLQDMAMKKLSFKGKLPVTRVVP